MVLNKPSPEHKVEDAEFEAHEVYAIDIVVSTGACFVLHYFDQLWCSAAAVMHACCWCAHACVRVLPAQARRTPSHPRATHTPTHARPPGEGKPKMLDERETTVYKRALDMEYQLKMKASRAVFSEINKRSPTMPFALRGLAEGDEKVELSEGQLRLGLVECLNHGLLHPYPVLHEKQGELVAQVRARGGLCRMHARACVRDAGCRRRVGCVACCHCSCACRPVLNTCPRACLLAAARSRARCC